MHGYECEWMSNGHMNVHIKKMETMSGHSSSYLF
jgi:hypothetical protein